jgi:hypothetical protein
MASNFYKVIRDCKLPSNLINQKIQTFKSNPFNTDITIVRDLRLIVLSFGLLVISNLGLAFVFIYKTMFSVVKTHS